MIKINLTLLLTAVLVPWHLPAQAVSARYAQYLVTSAMSAHPELQKMGIHVVPPDQQDEAIVACSVPSKIGKKSSAHDLEEERSGKPAVTAVTERSFYDLALPLSDAHKNPIGMIVMEMRFSGASDAADSIRKAEAIRGEMERQIRSLQSLFGEAPKTAPLVLVRSTPLPDITGDFDHFAVDRKNNRLYVSAEVHHSIEVFDLNTGEHLQSVAGVTTPHTLAFAPEKNELLVADGGDSSCRIFDVSDMHEVRRIPLEAGPDAGFYDSAKRLFYVGNGGRGAKAAFSYISVISVDKGKEIARIRVEASNVESMALNRGANLLYVNLRDKNAIGVVDLAKKEIRETWAVPGLNLNTPMSFDVQNHRLFIAGRKPGKLFILDSDSGRLIKAMDCVETADDMTFDPSENRIYISGSGGLTIVHEDGPDQFRALAEFGTNGGKTSIYDAASRRFFIAHTKTQEDNAALQVYLAN